MITERWNTEVFIEKPAPVYFVYQTSNMDCNGINSGFPQLEFRFKLPDATEVSLSSRALLFIHIFTTFLKW
jgi:hypothetical protein